MTTEENTNTYRRTASVVGCAAGCVAHSINLVPRLKQKGSEPMCEEPQTIHEQEATKLSPLSELPTLRLFTRFDELTERIKSKLTNLEGNLLDDHLEIRIRAVEEIWQSVRDLQRLIDEELRQDR